MDAAKIYCITTPIYYVNDQPHIGHAYTTVLADIVARYHRFFGDRTFLLTGTDEHGQKVARAAAAAGLAPQEQADRTVVRYRELWQRLDIAYDDFIRTTEPRHTAVVTTVLAGLWEAGAIYRGDYEGWYCTPCERFWGQDDLAGSACPDCGRPVERLREANYFFRQSNHQQWLREYIGSHPRFLQPEARRNEALGFLRKPLADLCISRPKSRLAWGVELPFDRDYVCYVWLDALLNYVSATGYLSDDTRFATLWPADHHLVGKDILTTHAVYWPIILKALGLPLPRTIFAHGWWLDGDRKISKSAGNAVDVSSLIDEFGGDALRWFLAAEAVTGQDAVFSRQRFLQRYNADLAGGIGNLASRVLALARQRFGGVIPDPQAPGKDEVDLRDELLRVTSQAPLLVEELALDRIASGIVTGVGAVNRYLQETKPWGIADEKRAATVVYTGLEALRLVATLALPVIPNKAAAVLQCLGCDADASDGRAQLETWGIAKPGSKLGSLGVLFPRKAAER
jgi:methionyl-tRNA synthetase